MQTIEGLKRRIQSTEDLLSVVRTMKALAAVNIRQYERAVESLHDYSRAVEMGLQVVLRDRPDFMVGAQAAPHDRLGAVIFGTDQGMCEVDRDHIECVRSKIYDRLKELNRLDVMKQIRAPKDWSTSATGGVRWAERPEVQLQGEPIGEKRSEGDK